jgi:hypothetical protein
MEIAPLPPTIQLYGQSLEPQARLKHRLWIGLRVEALLDGYWQNRPDESVKLEILGDWIDLLEAFTPEEIRDACRVWLRDHPRRKPNVGDVRALIQDKRGIEIAAYRANLPPPKERELAPVEERRAFAERILGEIRKA